MQVMCDKSCAIISMYSIYWKVLLIMYSRGGLGPSWRGPTASHDEEHPISVVIFDDGARAGSLRKDKLQVDRVMHELSQGDCDPAEQHL